MPFIAHSRRRRPIGLMLSLFLILSALNGRALLAQQQNLKQPIRVRIFNMHSITAQQAKDYLAQAEVGDTVVIIPNTTAVSVTAIPEELVFASSILKLVDSNEQFDIKFLDIEPDKTVPDSEKIQTKLGKEFTVGTLLEGPVSSSVAEDKIIVDKHKDKILIISPVGKTTAVVKAIQELLTVPEEPEIKTESQQDTIPSANDVNFVQEPVVIEANEIKAILKPNKPSTDDEMLGELMNELAESAKAEAEAKKVIVAPNETPKPVAETEISKTPQEAEQAAAKIETLPESEPIAVQAGQEEVNEIAEQTQAVEKIATVGDVDIPNGDEMLELNLPEKLDVVALIDLVGKQLNLNYLYDDTKVAGSVTVKVQGKIRVRELYNLLESVLKFRGFIMSRKGNLVTIAPAAEVLDQDPKFVDGGIKPGDVSVTNVFHLNYITTAAAKRLLTEMKLGSNITEIPETGTLVVTEYAFRIQRIEDLLNLVDVPGPPKEFRLRVLKYTLAESLVPKIKDLAEQLGTVQITIGVSAPAAPARVVRGRAVRTPTPQPTPQAESAKTTGVFVDFDKRTNRVLMIGLEGEMAAVDNIIDSLDVPQQDLRVIREYEMQYVDINKIVEALTELNIVEGVSTTGTTTIKRTTAAPGQPAAPTPAAIAAELGSQGGIILLDQPQVVMLEATNSLLVNATPEQHIQISQVIAYVDREPVQAAIPYRIYRLENQEPEALAEVLNGLIEKTVRDKEGKIQQTVKYTEESIAIVPDPGTFSLIVYASRKNQEWIGNLIKSLDRRRPQVLIDVSLVEITQDDKFQYDLDVITNATSIVSGSIGVKPSTINTGFPATSPSNKLFEGGYFGTSGTDSVAKGFFNAGRIQALLDLIDRNKYGRVLARPKILVNDNEEGTISTEDTRYVGQTTSTTVAGTAAASSDSVVQSTTFTPYTAKIELKITPQISEGDLLRLVIEMQRNDFQEGTGTTVNEIASPLNEKKSSVNTIVTIPDGSTIILGGLTKLQQGKVANKVPLLGDIPIAGTLFRSSSETDLGSKLYIFVKANIIRPEDSQGITQIKRISKENRDEFEKAEARFQNYQVIPGVKSTPIEPNKVLDQ